MLNAKKMVLLMLALVLLVVPAGCIFSPDDSNDDTPPVNNDLPPAATLTQLMLNFVKSYEDMEIDHWRQTMHQSYKTMLQAETVADFGLPEGHFTYEEEEAIHTNIFSRDAIQGPDGPVPGISEIAFTTMEIQEAWAPAPLDDPNFPGHQFALYRVRFEFARTEGTTLVVQGLIKFYAQQFDGIYKMTGQVDLTD